MIEDYDLPDGSKNGENLKDHDDFDPNGVINHREIPDAGIWSTSINSLLPA